MVPKLHSETNWKFDQWPNLHCFGKNMWWCEEHIRCCTDWILENDKKKKKKDVKKKPSKLLYFDKSVKIFVLFF